MKLAVSVLLMAAAMLLPSSARAHDPKQHKGKQTKGEIVSVAQDRIQLKAGQRQIVVLLSEKPKIEVNGGAATAAALAKGQKVAVIGTTLASGEIVAKEILVERSTAPASASGQGAHSGHKH